MSPTLLGIVSYDHLLQFPTGFPIHLACQNVATKVSNDWGTLGWDYMQVAKFLNCDHVTVGCYDSHNYEDGS